MDTLEGQTFAFRPAVRHQASTQKNAAAKWIKIASHIRLCRRTSLQPPQLATPVTPTLNKF